MADETAKPPKSGHRFGNWKVPPGARIVDSGVILGDEPEYMSEDSHHDTAKPSVLPYRRSAKPTRRLLI